jgi:hypothetical protein
MFRFIHLQRRLLLGVMVGGLLLGASVIQPGEALAGFSTSPSPRLQSTALLKSCTSGDHIKDVVIEL